MEDFKKPDRKARGTFSTFLYLDAEQTVNSLSALEGGVIDELRSISEEESTGGKGISGNIGYGPIKVGGNLSNDQRMRYEEEVLRRRTGVSRITTLLEKLREVGALGSIGRYTPEVYEQIEETELYEFEAEIRLHPFHKFVTLVQGADQFGRDWGMGDAEFEEMRQQVEDAFYGKGRDRATLVIFADIEAAEQNYRVAMPVREDHLLAGIEALSGRATFVAQVWRKVAEGQKVPAARLVRKMPFVSPFEQEMMVSMLPLLQDQPGEEQMGLDATEADILLRKPAVIMKPLCIYRG